MDKQSFSNTSYGDSNSSDISGFFEYLKNNIHIENLLDDIEDENFQIESLPEMDLYSKNSIYYVAGYIVRGILKKNMKCCVNNCLVNYVLEENPEEEYSRLTELRDFTHNALLYVNKEMFLFFAEMGNIFISNFNDLIKIEKNLAVVLQNLMIKINSSIECEILKKNLIKKFSMFCLRISSKKRKRPLKDYSSPSLNNCL